ncbi:MAG: YciI family protein [Alphaproteobacteria bacterium]|nr:YciI family protein [Alphaproteobacteria bacterium]
MKFMLLIHGNEQAMMEATKTDAAGMSPEYAAFNQALIKAGAMLAGERLRPTTTAASVRVRNGATEVLDGPYAETREQFGGFYIIEAADFDAAMDWAQQCPAAHFGTIEVRPVVQG